MVFSSLTFLFFFLPISLVLYYICPKKVKNLVLLVLSLLFYAWGEPVYIVLMIFSAISDYFHGLLIYKYREMKPSRAKLFLISSLIINIGLLSFFKYSDFLIENINYLFNVQINYLELPLPIGISFYTFQTMSYSIDVFRGTVLPQRNPIALATYVSLFPQLIAGPIVRYEVIEKELTNRTVSVKEFAEGVQLFIIGLGKKVLLANNIGLLWDEIQNQSISELSVLTTWLGIVAFALQIYFDFSGYSDMAIGLGKMFGFHFPKNFHYPYMSTSMTEFWRRWHMTLGNWFRDYVYIPLGGSRKGKWRLYLNLFIVWGLTGIWHGASWNFVMWGLYFAIFISIEKAGLLHFLKKCHPFFQHTYFIFFILIGWVLFAFDDYQKGLDYLASMFGFASNGFFDSLFMYYFYTNIVLLLIVLVAATPVWDTMREKFINKQARIMTVLLSVYYVCILIISTAYLVDESFNPFLYFRF
ncbi:MBOAT family O-acyltransferase [Bacillus massiliigorillae]|uniref:MBOAT family O-acyltransferase n=1 Tax=Bacillus massiliigorillae TaxID=1243664 RepID=UPI0003A5047E|nr:MBOAT family O-acyltransferase [Bacillus massiliigorillae]